MACIEEIAKYAKFIKIKDQLLVLIRRQVETELMLEEKFRDLRRDEKKRLDHLKQDQTMLVIKIFSEKKKVFRERKKIGKIHAKRMVVKEIEDGLSKEKEKFGWWFEQDIDGESEYDNEKNLVM
uniref:Uncharacterized protein n=1 Tax=Tanacetum cinerariifolium TaxID=118510 RepID=A0A6L2MGH5_TANCI|nr:hypothetical protein [Tanacetum cinerariifolium]